MVNGFYASALFKVGEKNMAKNHLQKVTNSNYLHQDKEKKWGFYEYIHGKSNTPCGVSYMAWSAAGQIFAFNYNKKIL